MLYLSLALFTQLSVSIPQLNAAIIELYPFGCQPEKALCRHNEITSQISELSGISINQRVLPYARAKKEFMDGMVDMLIIGKDQQLESKALLIKPLYELEFVLLSYTEIDQKQALKTMSIGIIGSSENALFAFAPFEPSSAVPFGDYSTALKVLEQRKIDAVFLPIELAKEASPKSIITRYSDLNDAPWKLDVTLYCARYCDRFVVDID